MIKLVAWIIVVTSGICFMYTFNQLVYHRPECATTTATTNITTLENFETTISSNHPTAIRTNSSSPPPPEKEKDDQPSHTETKGSEYDNDEDHQKEEPTQSKHIVFGIAASSSLWDKRKEYIKQWWKPNQTRGVVWLDNDVKIYKNENLPEIRVSEDTGKFRYTNRLGDRSALRISRVVSETLNLGMKDVRWFVMGDDDTIFVVDNVVRILQKYDHRQLYYIGSNSESHVQNIVFSYAMAYGGGGFAISYPLAQELAKMQDRCIQRYPALYGSDDRIQACMAELGVPLTKESGFHQYDVYGDLLGLLAAHPVTPLVSIHHLDVVEPIFPQMTRTQAIGHLFESANQDSASIMQQSICYDKKRFWSISVSWGYAVQIIRGVISPRELEMPTRTFLNWYKRADYTGYSFNTRPVTRHPCQSPYIYYMSRTRYDRGSKQTIGIYRAHDRYKHPHCRWRMENPEKIDSVVVLKRPDNLRWQKIKIVSMDNIVDALNNAYQDFLAAAAGVLEAKDASGTQKTTASDAALENFKQRWELLRVACDQAEEFVESVKQRIGSECLVDEATGSLTGKPGQPAAGLPPISVVRLEQMSKAVRWLVIELQQGSGNSGGSSHPNTSAPFDARFAEDTTQ